jgi:hypothetical protein
MGQKWYRTQEKNMRYEELEQLHPPAFKRACGVSRQTFSVMVEVLQPHLERRGKRGGQNHLLAGIINFELSLVS